MKACAKNVSNVIYNAHHRMQGHCAGRIEMRRRDGPANDGKYMRSRSDASQRSPELPETHRTKNHPGLRRNSIRRVSSEGDDDQF